MSKRMLLIVVAALAAGLGLWAGLRMDRGVAGSDSKAMPALQATTLLPRPRALPEFALQQSDGTPLTQADLAGRWTLVFLGFTHCPDLCPTTLAKLAQAQKAWESLPEARRPRLLFVSVDPARDTPQRAGRYAQGFHPETLAATGESSALEAFAASLSLVFMPPPPADAGHVHGAPPASADVDHSGAIALLDPQVRMAGVITPPLEPGKIASDVERLAMRAP